MRRSRFITTLGHAATAEQAQAFVAATAAEFPDATHHCWAFVAGPPGSTAHVGMSDDGEPRGTAGRPMLNALLHGEVGEIVAVVTRYYGGVQLGRGGLGRAYSGGVRAALESLPRTEHLVRRPVEADVSYPVVDAVLDLLSDVEAVRTGEEFGERVRLRADIPTDRIEELERRFPGVTGGTGVLRTDQGRSGSESG